MIYHGDLFDVLPRLAEASIDACVTDPPYGIGFMGREWDTFKPGTGKHRRLMHPRERALGKIESDNPNLNGRWRSPALSPSQIDYDYSVAGLRAFQAWTEKWATEAIRVLKPGAYLVVCGAPRSYHRMACGLEDAGLEIRDCLAWLFGSGFPKSLNLGDGLGTALKPGHEPIVLARKPFKGTVRGNVDRYGTGALNIAACRLPSETESVERAKRGGFEVSTDGRGRWPPNVALDEIAAMVLDEQSGDYSGHRNTDKTREIYGKFLGTVGDSPHTGDSGGASRFYYVAKPSREERDYGCDRLPPIGSLEAVSRDPLSAGANNPRAGAGRLAVLNTSEIVYTDPEWVNAVLARRLPADTDSSRPRVIGGSTTECSDGSAWSMCWCGSPSTDPYHPVVKSIIETETSSITSSTISNSSRRPHTNGCMAAAFGVTAAGGNLAAYAEFQSPWARLIGTSPKKAGRSTADVNLATSIASWLTSAPAKPENVRRNGHPTVKPVELMRWLVRLVTPPGGTVLDPFGGSGTTAMACRYEQRQYVIVEREAEYVEIIKRRVSAVAPLFGEIA